MVKTIKDHMSINNSYSIEYCKVDDLIPYARNARTHSEEQVAQIAGSIREFGFTNPVLIDAEGGIIAGHGRVMAARKLGLDKVPCIRLAYLTETQKRAYIIADNKLALNAGWDTEMLALELNGLQELCFDLELTGFNDIELNEILTGIANDNDEASDGDGEAYENYSRKIDPPIYRITGECPSIQELFDRSKSLDLRAEIDACKFLSPEVADFLRHAAERHTVFNFKNIAEFYAHADEHVQSLMERSALIIIDFDKAIENGFIKIANGMMEQVAEIKKNEA